MPAIDVFINVIAHLKECILQHVRVQNYGIKDDDIQYVMTVPAIWSEAAKQFMREAATDPRVRFDKTRFSQNLSFLSFMFKAPMYIFPQ